MAEFRDTAPLTLTFTLLLTLGVFRLFNTPSLRNRRLEVMKERAKKAQERKGRARETLEGKVSRVSPSRAPFFLEPLLSTKGPAKQTEYILNNLLKAQSGGLCIYLVSIKSTV